MKTKTLMSTWEHFDDYCRACFLLGWVFIWWLLRHLVVISVGVIAFCVAPATCALAGWLIYKLLVGSPL